MHPNPETARPDESLRSVVYRMAKTGISRLPVVSAEEGGRLVGMVTLTDLLQARAQHLEVEERREQILPHPFSKADVGTARRYAPDRRSPGERAAARISAAAATGASGGEPGTVGGG
jgi:hypothetical protein